MFNSDLDSPDHLTSTVQYPTISVQTNPTSGRSSLCKGSKFTNNDIPGPKGTKSTWMQIFLPMWFEYLGTLNAHNSVIELIQNGDFPDAKHPSVMETQTSATICQHWTGATHQR